MLQDTKMDAVLRSEVTSPVIKKLNLWGCCDVREVCEHDQCFYDRTQKLNLKIKVRQRKQTCDDDIIKIIKGCSRRQRQTDGIKLKPAARFILKHHVSFKARV